MNNVMRTMIPIFAASFISAAFGADLLLAQEYKNQDIAGWAMSEKFGWRTRVLGRQAAGQIVRVMRLHRPKVLQRFSAVSDGW